MLYTPTYSDVNTGGILADYAWSSPTSNTANLDNCTVTGVRFFLMNTTATTLIFDNLRSIANPTINAAYLNGVLDAYGQFTKRTWTGKVIADADLTRITSYNVCYTKLLRINGG